MTASSIPKNHPPAYLLHRRAAGQLSPAMDYFIQSHLSFCPQCRQHLQACEAAAGLSLENLTPEEMDTNCLDNLLAKIDEHGPPQCIDVTIPPPPAALALYPEPLHGLLGENLQNLFWKEDNGFAEGRILNQTHLPLRLIRTTKGGKADLRAHPDSLFMIVNNPTHTNFSANFSAGFCRGDVVDPRRCAIISDNEILLLMVTAQKEDKMDLWEKITNCFSR